MKLVYSKNYSDLTNIFVLRLFKIVANQTESSKLEHRFVIKFLWLRNANHVKFTEEYVMCTEKQVLIKQRFIKEQKIGLPLRITVEKTVHALETHWLFGKEKVLGAAISKESNADSVLRHELTQNYWFPWKSATANSALYYQVRQNSPYLLNYPPVYVFIYIYVYIYILRNELLTRWQYSVLSENYELKFNETFTELWL